MAFHVRAGSWTGPFDLLLQLVARQRVTIGAIRIADIADQYIAEVDRMADLDLEVATDFVLVAATLLDIKAASLIPNDSNKHDDFEDEDDELAQLSPDEARDVLVSRLIAYAQFRAASWSLAAREEAEARMHGRSAGPDPEFLGLMPDYLEGISLRSLAVICADVVARHDEVLLEAEHVAPRRRPVALTTVGVDRMLRSHKTLTFTELLAGNEEPENIVANLLAILELFKLGKANVEQIEAFGEIEVSHIDGADPYAPPQEALLEAAWLDASDEPSDDKPLDGVGAFAAPLDLE